MELKFEKNPLTYLRPFYNQQHTQEQTQEIRLPDSYPDIGKVLQCWAQVLIRGKEWRSSSMGANGGVMVWVLYAPEDGTQPRVVDTWLPIQCHWDFPENADDGVMVIHSMINSLDCRGLSARKLMIRVGIDSFAQALRKDKISIAQPGEIPEDIQLRKCSYPMELPMESGEKQVQLEEYLEFDEKMPQIGKMISYSMMPQIQEQKVLGDRLVFRGQIKLKLHYMTEDGDIMNWETNIPFSQYTELDGEYAPSATSWIIPIMTASELELSEEGKLQMRVGIAAQYTIFDQIVLDVVEDAYSPYRDVSATVSEVQLPALLGHYAQMLKLSGNTKYNAEKIYDTAVFAEYPKCFSTDAGIEIRSNGQMQLLYRDAEGQMVTDTVRLEGRTEMDCAGDNLICLWPGYVSEDSCEVMMDVQVFSAQTIPMITELELGQQHPADDTRPTIILRRAGEDDLWEIAKNYGSTVAAIQEANQLSGEPASTQMLLIPIA